MSDSIEVSSQSSVSGTLTEQEVEGIGGTDAEDSLSRDEVFEILSNHRRRYTLHHLQRNGESTSLGELSENVAAWENEIDREAVSAAERKRVYTSLQQFHLPKLDKKGVVDFDDRSGTVELGDAAKDVDIYLEVVEGRDIPWSQFYLGLAAVNLALLVATFAGTAPLTMIPESGWGIFVATTVLVSALAHTYYNHTEMRLGDTEKPPEVEE